MRRSANICPFRVWNTFSFLRSRITNRLRMHETYLYPRGNRMCSQSSWANDKNTTLFRILLRVVNNSSTSTKENSFQNNQFKYTWLCALFILFSLFIFANDGCQGFWRTLYTPIPVTAFWVQIHTALKGRSIVRLWVKRRLFSPQTFMLLTVGSKSVQRSESLMLSFSGVCVFSKWLACYCSLSAQWYEAALKILRLGSSAQYTDPTAQTVYFLYSDELWMLKQHPKPPSDRHFSRLEAFRETAYVPAL